MTISIFPGYELDRAGQIFKLLHVAVRATGSNASLAHELTVWQNQRRESEEFLRGAEAAQRLQGCRSLRGRRLGPRSRHRASFSGLRHFELGRPIDRARNRDRISNRAGDRMGV